MRSLIVMAMFTASIAHASWLQYSEERELALDAAGIDELEIVAGAGSTVINGVEGADSILVIAEINVDEADDDKAREFIAKKAVLDLEGNGSKAKLRSYFDSNGWFSSTNGGIKLDIRVPVGMHLVIDDGAGSLDVFDTEGNLTIDDGSGSIEIRNVATLRIDDGSGSIDVRGASGDVDIVDGSGSMKIRGVGGTVTIDDGSGSINVNDVMADVIIEDDGSGGVTLTNVQGSVHHDD